MLPPGALYGTEKLAYSTARLLFSASAFAPPRCMHLESIKSASPAPSSAGVGALNPAARKSASLASSSLECALSAACASAQCVPGHTCVAPISAQSTSCSATNAVNKQQCLPKPAAVTGVSGCRRWFSAPKSATSAESSTSSASFVRTFARIGPSVRSAARRHARTGGSSGSFRSRRWGGDKTSPKWYAAASTCFSVSEMYPGGADAVDVDPQAASARASLASTYARADAHASFGTAPVTTRHPCSCSNAHASSSSRSAAATRARRGGAIASGGRADLLGGQENAAGRFSPKSGRGAFFPRAFRFVSRESRWA